MVCCVGHADHFLFITFRRPSLQRSPGMIPKARWANPPVPICSRCRSTVSVQKAMKVATHAVGVAITVRAARGITNLGRAVSPSPRARSTSGASLSGTRTPSHFLQSRRPAPVRPVRNRLARDDGPASNLRNSRRRLAWATSSDNTTCSASDRTWTVSSFSFFFDTIPSNDDAAQLVACELTRQPAAVRQ